MTFSLSYLLFLPLYVLSFPTSATNFPPPTTSTQLSSTAFPLLFHLHFHSHFNCSAPLLIPTYLPSMFPHSRNSTLLSISITTEATISQDNSSSHQQQRKPRLLHTTHVLPHFHICRSFGAHHIPKYHLFQIYRWVSIPGLPGPPGLVIMKTHTIQLFFLQSFILHSLYTKEIT